MQKFLDLPYTKHVLKSGLTVLLVPMENVQSATVLVYVNTGSRYEPQKWSGISHFLEHMVFKGTEKYPTPLDLSAAVDAVGAEFNAFTSKEYTAYYVKAASQHIDLAVDVVSDMLLTPKLPPEDLEREKGVIVEEINMYNDMPASHIGNVFEQLMFSGTNLGTDVIGTKETVRALTRENFVEYLREWYGLGNVVLTIAGDAKALRSPALLENIEKSFSKKSDTTSRKNGGTRQFAGEPKAKLALRDRVRVDFKKTDQAHFILAMPGLKRGHDQRYPAAVLSVLFGGNMSSRLFTEVREKRGLCYYVHSDLDFYHETGVFGASAGVDPTRVEEAIKVVKDEFAHLLDESGERKITDAEVKRAKDYLIGKTLLSLEDTESVANAYGARQLLLGEVETYKESLEKIEKVTVEEVRAIANRLVQADELRFAMIGPFKKTDVFENMLK